MRGGMIIRLTAFAALLFAVPASAQDALTAAPKIFKKVMENDKIRVLEANFGPGDKAAPHSHPEHLFYMLTPGTLIIKPPGRTPYEMTFKTGEAVYLPAQTRATETGGDKALRALIVEIKTPQARPSARRSGKGKRGRRGTRSRRR